MLFRKIIPLKSLSRQFQTSILRLSADSFHVQDEADFQKEIIESKKLFLVDFYARWCGPCKLLEPRLEKLINNYNQNLNESSGDRPIALAKVDIDRFEELTAKYNVKAVPTVVAIRNGKEVARFTGLIDEDRIETIFDQLNR